MRRQGDNPESGRRSTTCKVPELMKETLELAREAEDLDQWRKTVYHVVCDVSSIFKSKRRTNDDDTKRNRLHRNKQNCKILLFLSLVLTSIVNGISHTCALEKFCNNYIPIERNSYSVISASKFLFYVIIKARTFHLVCQLAVLLSRFS